MRLIPLVLLLILPASVPAQDTSALVQPPSVFEQSIRSGSAVVLDVRTAKEFRAGHLPDAMQANWNDTAEFRLRLQHIDREQPVYVYCLVGARSASAARWMRTNGFTHVIELQGGINAWKAAGKPLESAVQVEQISRAAFDKMIPKNKTVLVDIGADWCPPCRKMQPVVAELKADRSLQFEMISIDAGEQTDIQQELNVKAIPTFIIYKNGKQVWRGEGVIPTNELKKNLR